MSEVVGKCVICTLVFTLNSVSALQCGHTFHYECINRWIENSRTCPICRVRTAPNNVIRHLYFETSNITATQDEECSAAKLESLSIAYEKARQDYSDAAEKLENLRTSYAILQSKYESENKRYWEKIPLLQARNQHLEMMLIDKEDMEKQVEKLKNRLRACEFYKIVTMGKEDDAMDKYLKGDGGVETAQFIFILRRQLDQARTTITNLSEKLKARMDQLKRSERKENELKNIVKALEKELRDVRCSANMKSSETFNPKLASLALEQSPARRPSLGFDETVDIDDDVLGSALRHRSKRMVSLSKPCARLRRHQLLEDSGNEENDLISTCFIPQEFPSHVDDIQNPRVPKSIKERVLSDSKVESSTGRGGAYNAVSKALANIENKRTLAPSAPSRRPLSKPTTSGVTSKNRRLSMYFAKPTDIPKVIELDDSSDN